MSKYICSSCNSNVNTTTNTITIRDGVKKRYRKCECGNSFSTIEIPNAEFVRLKRLEDCFRGSVQFQ